MKDESQILGSGKRLLRARDAIYIAIIVLLVFGIFMRSGCKSAAHGSGPELGRDYTALWFDPGSAHGIIDWGGFGEVVRGSVRWLTIENFDPMTNTPYWIPSNCMVVVHGYEPIVMASSPHSWTILFEPITNEFDAPYSHPPEKVPSERFSDHPGPFGVPLGQ